MTDVESSSPAVQLRAETVLLVLRTMRWLLLAQWADVFLLLAYGRTVPGELWLAAGSTSTFFVGLLVNTKHERSVTDPAPVQVVNPIDQPVPVDDTS